MSLTVRERLQALLDGRKIRKTEWPPHQYVSQDISYCNSDSMLLDYDWEIYEEPAKEPIKITEKDVGRKVRLRNNVVCMISGYDGRDGSFYSWKRWRDSDDDNADNDIVEFLD